MNRKKLYAALTASACLATTFASMPQIMTSTRAAEVTYDSFDVNYDGWHGTREDNDIVAVENAGLNGSRGMAVTNRTSPSDGAASSKGLYLFGGIKYNYSMNVFSETDETYHLTLRYISEITEKETIVELASKKVKAGEWAEISASYKAPKDTYEYELTLTTESTNDFMFDDFKITTKKANMEALAAPAGKGLKDEFGAYFRVGNILNGYTVKNSGITGVILKDHNAIECENETKPDATLVKNGSSDTNIQVSLNSCSAIADFAAKNGLGFRGHTFVWHSQTPEWFFQSNFNGGNYVDKNTMNKRMESYIKNMFAAYKSKYPTLDVYAYDVCNECVSDDANRTANAGGARQPGYGNGASPWVKVYGDNSFVEQAFTYARKYAPETCKLYYNDYNEYWDHKRNCIANMTKNLKAKGILDGVGMQSHINADWNGFSGISAYENAMKMYLNNGCDVQITELDISTEGGKYSLDDQAKKYAEIFKFSMDWNKSHPNGPSVTLVQVWGPNDANSWVGTDKATGRSNAPLLYDKNNQAKAAYSAITSLVPDSQWTTGIPYTGPGAGKYTPPNYDPDENGYYFHSTFEGSTDEWEGRGAASVITSGRTAYEGKEALLVQDRTASWNGGALQLSPAFKAGETYSFSTNAMTFDGGETTTFKFTLQYTDAAGETKYSEIASGTAPKGEWIQLANTAYTIPSGASNLMIYVETTDEDSTMNFYIDDVYGAIKDKEIKGAGQPKVRTLVRGDVDFDGEITAFDMVTERKAVLGDVTDALTLKAADVDESTKVEVNDLVLLQEFLLGKIKEFPRNLPPIPQVESSTIGKFNGISIADSWKMDGENNPMTTQRFGADPGWMVYKDRLYIYTTNDAFEYQNNGNMQENTYNSGTINCVSTADMVNWTDHGAIPVADRNGRTTNGAAKWAGAAWAPDACWKTINGKDKFFLYFANSAGGIGVLTADSPTGPWTDPLGHALITGATPNCNDVVWMFDPGVYYDPATDEAYIAFGGGRANGVAAATPGTGRIAKLGKDMISLDGNPVKMQTPYLFEDSSLIKINDTWYYSYCSNWNVPSGNNINGVSFNSADIVYMTSKNPLGPWGTSNVAGMVFANTGAQRLDNNGNNHHSIVYFKNKYYVVYHTRQQAIRMTKANGYKFYNTRGELTNSGDGNYRSTCINEATFNNGKLSCKGDTKGCSQIEYLNVYDKVQAETMSNQSKGIEVTGLYDTKVKVKKGQWIKVSGADLSKGVNAITVKGSSSNGTAVKFCVGSPTGTAIGYGILDGNENTLAATDTSVTGVKDIYMVFSGDGEFDYWSFS